MFNILGILFLGFVFAILSNNTIDQTPKKRTYTTPTPYCRSCATKLAWKDMIPFWSYFRTSGKCPYCSEALPTRHILIDVLELAWVSVYVWKFGWSYEGSVSLIFGMALLGIIFLSKEKRELNDSLLLILGMLAVINFLAYNPDRFPEAAISMILGAASLSLYNLTKIFATEDNNFDLTELKLGALLGLFLGLKLGLVTLFIAVASGAVIGSFNIQWLKISAREAMPQFSELLASAGLISILWGNDILGYYQALIQ